MTLIGKTILHYKILEKIGEGGMGEVYKAEDIKLKRHVALKFLPPHLTRDPEAKKRFIKEAQAASALQHTNICTIYEINKTDEGQIYLSMEYLAGKTLKETIEEDGLTVEATVDIITQAARGLEKAHKKGIVHRDIKPANIMVTEDGVVKIVDFGLAKLAGRTVLTREGTTLGTVAYMSPEQTTGAEVDHRSDIWSLGVTLYEMLSGEKPFKGDYEQAVIYSIMNEAPQAVAELKPEIPVTLGQVVSKALEKTPEARYQQAGDLLDDLKSISAGIVPDEIKVRLRKEKIRKKRKGVLYAVAIVLIIALAATAIWQLFGQKSAVVPIIEDSIAVISFENMTGDVSQDILKISIPNLLITNLENTGFFHVVTWDRLRDLLKQLGRSDEENIGMDLGFELCRREGIAFIVLGSVMKVGDMFATTVDVWDVESEELLKSTRSQGEGMNSIINSQVAELSREIALGMGIAREEVASANLNISEFTTTSMEAYQYFIKGREDFYDQYIKDAIIRLEKAVELDPDFAMAYLYLGYTHNHLMVDLEKGKEYYEKARSLTEKVTEKEKLLIEAEYTKAVEFVREKWLEIMHTIIEKYPREKQAHLELCKYYRASQMYDESIKHAEIVLALDPGRGDAYEDLAFAYTNIGDDKTALEYLEKGSAALPGDPRMNIATGHLYVKMGKIDDAIRKFKTALDLEPDFPIQNYIAYAYAMKEDYSEAFAWCEKFRENPLSEGIKAKGYWLTAFYHRWLGNIEQAIEDSKKAWDIFHGMGNRDFMSEYLLGGLYHERGEMELSRDYFQNWYDGILEMCPPEAIDQRSYAAFFLHHGLGLILLEQGHIESARFHLQEMEALMPRISSPQKHQGYNRFLGLVLIAEESYGEAIFVLKEAPILKMSTLWTTQYLIAFNHDETRALLARAYKQNGDLEGAIEVYGHLTDPNAENRDGRLINPINYYHLAACYEMKGWKSRAVKLYEKFLLLYKDADPVPEEMGDAKKRMENLTIR